MLQRLEERGMSLRAPKRTSPRRAGGSPQRQDAPHGAACWWTRDDPLRSRSLS
jgi:hypothetical protein